MLRNIRPAKLTRTASPTIIDMAIPRCGLVKNTFGSLVVMDRAYLTYYISCSRGKDKSSTKGTPHRAKSGSLFLNEARTLRLEVFWGISDFQLKIFFAILRLSLWLLSEQRASWLYSLISPVSLPG